MLDDEDETSQSSKKSSASTNKSQNTFQNKEEIVINSDRSLFGIAVFIAVFSLLPLFYLVIFGKQINISAAQKTIETNFGVKNFTAQNARLYLRPFPKFYFEDVSFNNESKSGSFAIKVKSASFYGGFGSLFSIKKAQLDNLTLKNSSISFKVQPNQQLKSSDVVDFILNSSFNRGSVARKISIKNLSVLTINDNEFIVRGLNIADVIFKQSPSITKIYGKILVDKTLYNIKYDYHKNNETFTEAKAGGDDIKLAVSSPFFTANFEGTFGANVLKAKLNTSIKTLKYALFGIDTQNGGSLVNPNNFLQDIENLTIDTNFEYNTKTLAFTSSSGVVNQDGKKIADIKLVDNLLEFSLNNINITKSSQDVRSQQVKNNYKEIMSYDNDDIGFLGEKNTASLLKSWSDLSQDQIQTTLQSVVKDKLSVFSIVDFLPQTPVNFAFKFNSVKIEDTILEGQVYMSASHYGLALKNGSSIKLTKNGKTSTINGAGSIDDISSGVKKTMLNFDINLSSMQSIYEMLEAKKFVNIKNFIKNETTSDPVEISFSLIKDRDLTIVDGLKLNFGKDRLNIDSKIQISSKAGNGNKSSQLYTFDIQNLIFNPNFEDIAKLNIFAGKSMLLNKMLVLKSILQDINIFVNCKTCTIFNNTFETFTFSLDINNSGLKFAIIEAASPHLSFGLDFNAEIALGVPSLEIKSNISKLVFDDNFSLNSFLTFIANKNKTLVLPSINQFFGLVDIQASYIKNKNYTLDNFIFAADISNGVLNITNANVSGLNTNNNNPFTIVTEGTISLQAAPIYSLSFAVQNAEANDIFTTFAALPNAISGRLDSSGRIVSSGYHFDDFIKNLSSDINFKIFNPKITNFDVNSIALSMLKPTKKEMQILADPAVIKSSITNGSKNYYSILQGKMVVNARLVSFVDTFVKSNLTTTSVNANYSLFDKKCNIVGKTALNAINFGSGERFIPLFLAFSASGSPFIASSNTLSPSGEKSIQSPQNLHIILNDLNTTQLTAYIEAYNKAFGRKK